MLRIAVLAIVGLTLLAPGSRALAQSGATVSPAFRDSATVRLVLAAIIGASPSALARGAKESGRRPWIIVSSATSFGTDWPALRAELVRLLRADSTPSPDSAASILSLEHVHTDSDTLTIRFSIGSRWRCGEQWKGASTAFEVRMPWSEFTWEPKAIDYEWSSSGACERTP